MYAKVSGCHSKPITVTGTAALKPNAWIIVSLKDSDALSRNNLVHSSKQLVT